MGVLGLPADRDDQIRHDYAQRHCTGETLVDLSDRYQLSVSQIYKIARANKGQGTCQECANLAAVKGLCLNHYWQQWWRSQPTAKKRQYRRNRSASRRARQFYAAYIASEKGQSARWRSQQWEAILRFLNTASEVAIYQQFPGLSSQALQLLQENRPLNWKKIRELLNDNELIMVRSLNFDLKKARKFDTER